METKRIAIYTAGGFGREVAWLIESCNENAKLYEILCFIDDTPGIEGNVLNDIPVYHLESATRMFPGALIVVASGDPQVRSILVKKSTDAGFKFTTIIHPRVEMSKWIDIGIGSVICAGNIMTTNIIIGEHVHINLDCTIGHDAILDDFATLAPGVHVSGRVHIGKRAYLGTGAVIINGKPGSLIHIGEDAVIGAGAVVTRSIPSGVTAVGVPAKIKQ